MSWCKALLIQFQNWMHYNTEHIPNKKFKTHKKIWFACFSSYDHDFSKSYVISIYTCLISMGKLLIQSYCTLCLQEKAKRKQEREAGKKSPSGKKLGRPKKKVCLHQHMLVIKSHCLLAWVHFCSTNMGDYLWGNRQNYGFVFVCCSCRKLVTPNFPVPFFFF